MSSITLQRVKKQKLILRNTNAREKLSSILGPNQLNIRDEFEHK